jgi:uncharacterized protein
MLKKYHLRMSESNLEVLLQTMQPVLNPKAYVFTIVPLGSSLPDGVLGMFQEAEGLTLILEQSRADELKLEYSAAFAWISLSVFSSLEAVGLTAAFANALTKAGISCNVVAAFHHDHIFVPLARAEDAMQVLLALSQ